MKKSWIRYCVRLRAKGWAPLVGHTLSLNAKKQHKVFETISVEEYCVIWWQAVSSNIRGRWKATGKIFCNFNQIFRYTCRIMPKRVKSSKGPSSRQCAGATQILSKKCCCGGEPLATLRPIWPAQDFNLRPPASKTNALPLDHRTVSASWLKIFAFGNNVYA